MSASRRGILKLSMGGATAFGLGGCITPGQQRQDALLRLSREFNNDLRWARYDTAVAHFQPAEARRFLKRVDLVGEELVIADHEMTSIKFEDPALKARTVAVFEWYTKRDPVLRKTSISQDWLFEEGVWRVTKQVRLRGPRFPLVPELASETAEGAPSPESGAPASPPADTEAP